MHDRLSVRTTAMLVIAWLTLAAAPGAAQNRGLQPTDFYSEVGVGEVAISPDGALVAFTVTTVNEEDNRRHREVWMQELRAGGPEGEPFRFTAMVARQPGAELPVAPGRRRRRRGNLVRQGDVSRR